MQWFHAVKLVDGSKTRQTEKHLKTHCLWHVVWVSFDRNSSRLLTIPQNGRVVSIQVAKQLWNNDPMSDMQCIFRSCRLRYAAYRIVRKTSWRIAQCFFRRCWRPPYAAIWTGKKRQLRKTFFPSSVFVPPNETWSPNRKHAASKLLVITKRIESGGWIGDIWSR